MIDTILYRYYICVYILRLWSWGLSLLSTTEVTVGFHLYRGFIGEDHVIEEVSKVLMCPCQSFLLATLSKLYSICLTSRLVILDLCSEGTWTDLVSHDTAMGVACKTLRSEPRDRISSHWLKQLRHNWYTGHTLCAHAAQDVAIYYQGSPQYSTSNMCTLDREF